MFDVDKLTNAELDRLQQRLSARASQREAEQSAAERERLNPPPLRPGIGNADIGFGNDIARRNWDLACLTALERQTVRYAVAPMTAVTTRDRERLIAGQEVRPSEHLDARNGDLATQMAKLTEGGYVLEKAGAR
jgi:hypothetical protein